MAANRPTEESYRSDGYSYTSHSTSGKIASKKSFRKHGSGGSVKFADAAGVPAAPAHEHYEIPDEDITTYTEEEKSLFETFNKANSAFLNFGGVYDEDDETYGENFDIPISDGPAYSEDEIIKFDLFQKAKSACIQFDGVYDSDEEFEGGYNKQSDNEDAEVYTDTEIQEQPVLPRVPSAFVQFGVYDGEEEEGEESYVEYNELRFQNVPAKTRSPVPASSVTLAAPAVPAPDVVKPMQARGGKNNNSDSSAATGADQDIQPSAEAGKGGLDTDLPDSEGNELDSSASPGKPALSKSRQGSLTLATIVEGREGEEYSPALTPVAQE
jgi:hypothetical protein